MDDRASRELLERLSLAAGPPGAEGEVRELVRRTIEGVGPIRYDRLGSLICERRGSADSPRVVIDSHMDEVALMVQSVTAAGRLSFVPLGGWWGHVLLAQRVDVLTDRGKVPGVVGSTPPHFLPADERDKVLQIEQMYIDVGASERSQVEQLGIRVGDPVVPRTEFCPMAPADVLSGKALDNRVGLCLMCETLLALQDLAHPNTVIGVGAVQEEVGLRGAGTAAELTRPDLALVLECAPADDLPGRDEPQAVLGRGPQVRLYDPTAISNRRLVRFVESTAADCGIKIQLAVRRTGGTDAGAIQHRLAGVPTVVLAVPGRYIHSHVSLMHWQDYRAARDLVRELVLRLDGDHVASFTRFE